MKIFLFSIIVMSTVMAVAQEAAVAGNIPVIQCKQVSAILAGQLYDAVIENKRDVENDIEAVKDCNAIHAKTIQNNGDQALSIAQYREIVQSCDRSRIMTESMRKFSQKRYSAIEFRNVRNFKNKDAFMSAATTNSKMSCDLAAVAINKLTLFLNQQ